jgi:hypothetical protein
MANFQHDQKLMGQARKNISDAISNLAEHKDAIELLTMTRGYKSIFKLKDDEWVKFSKMNLAMRVPFEKAVNTPQTIDVLSLIFGD